MQWRDHLKEQLARTRQTAEHGLPSWIARQQKKLVAHLEKQLAEVEKERQAALARALEELDSGGDDHGVERAEPPARAGHPQRTLFSTAGGMLLSHLPELGTLNRQEAAALAGLAPWVRQSGGGRAAVRRALYMSAVGLARMPESTLGKFYARLRAAGQPAKVALTAVMRKLLLQMNRVLTKLARQTKTATQTQPA